jgi:hypothetical protein
LQAPATTEITFLHEPKRDHERGAVDGAACTVEPLVSVLDGRPSENWKGAYNIIPAPAGELRRKLFAMTTADSPTGAAARCLNRIDEIRDEYGAPDSEPRHPDLASGKRWPVMMPDPGYE